MTNEELIQEYQNGNLGALDELLEQNKGLVGFAIRKYRGLANPSLGIEDLQQEAWIGFLRAVQKYNINQPVRFSSYAVKAMVHAVIRAIDQDSQKLPVISLDDEIPGTDGLTVQETIPDEQVEQAFKEVESSLFQKEFLNEIFEDSTTRNIFTDFYLKSMTIKSISEKYKMSLEEVIQVKNGALGYLKYRVKGEGLSEKYFNYIPPKKKTPIERFTSSDEVINLMASIDLQLKELMA